MNYLSYVDKRGILKQQYTQAPILPSPHFRWAVKIYKLVQDKGGTGLRLCVLPSTGISLKGAFELQVFFLFSEFIF